MVDFQNKCIFGGQIRRTEYEKDNNSNRRFLFLRKKYNGQRPCPRSRIHLHCQRSYVSLGHDTEKLRKEIRNIRISFRLNPATGRPDTYLNGVNVENRIRTMEVSSKVSPISALNFVRTEMVAQQQAMGKEKGIVMDGRDIGTTVFPEAELKIFVTATPEIRAQRRYDELKAKGQEASFDEILENVKQRDYIDQHRDVSPLRKAEDALLLDNTNLTIEQQKEWLFEQFNKVSGIQ